MENNRADTPLLLIDGGIFGTGSLTDRVCSLGVDFLRLDAQAIHREVVSQYRNPLTIVSSELAKSFLDLDDHVQTAETNEKLRGLVVVYQEDNDVAQAGYYYSLGADVVIPATICQERFDSLVRNWLCRRQALCDQKGAVVAHSLASVESAYDKTIEGWVQVLDMRDDETEGHSIRVAQMTVQFARAYDIEGDELRQIWRGALLHDVGKLVIPDSILKKQGKLSEEERTIMERHPVTGYEMLSGIEYLKPSLMIPLYHHERWDGSGYPFQISGADIHLHARIFAVVDVYDALSFDRCYRKALPRLEVEKHLQNRSGSHFDPEVVKTFLKILDRLQPGSWADSVSPAA